MEYRKGIGPNGNILEERAWLKENSPGIEFFNEEYYYEAGGRGSR